MFYDDYSTSFQSLYKPMYNVQANYNANMNGGMGAGGAGYNGMSGMGYMSPMMNIGVGQFGADHLVKGDENRNNYYARPIAAHKKKDDIPAMLGILATALGTTALLIALSKGKFKGRPGSTPPVPGPTPPVPGPTPPVPGPTPPVPGPTPPVPGPTPPVPGPTPPVPGPTPPVPGPTPPVPGPTPPVPGPTRSIAGMLPALPGSGVPITGTVVNNLPSVIQNPIAMTGSARRFNRITLQDRAVDVPFESILQPRLIGSKNINLPVRYLGNNSSVPPLPNKPQLALPQTPVTIKGALPAPGMTAKYQQALLKQQAAMNLPSSGVVHTSLTPELGKVNDNLLTHNPELLRNGSIIHTTHTPESIAQGYSIGSNAKGADKLAALLAQLQG